MGFFAAIEPLLTDAPIGTPMGTPIGMPPARLGRLLPAFTEFERPGMEEPRRRYAVWALPPPSTGGRSRVT